MKSVFLELPAFERHRADYLDDEAYRAFQVQLMRSPHAGDVIQGTAGYVKYGLKTNAEARASVAGFA